MKPEENRGNTGNVYEFTPEGRRRSAAAAKTKKGRPSKTSFLLGGVCILLFVVCIVLMALLIDAHDNDKKDADSSANGSICLTQECVASAARISSSLDHGAKPCEDFYQFACGGWLQKNLVPEDKGSLTFLGQFQNQIDIIIKNLLEADTDSLNLRSFREAKTFYKSCMNETQINTVNTKDLWQSLHNLGGLPLITPDWTEEKFDLKSALVRMTEFQTQPFLDLTVDVDPNNNHKSILKLTLKRQWHLPNSENPNTNLKLISSMVKNLGGTEEKMADAAKVLELHNKLDEIEQRYSREPGQNKVYVQVSSLQTRYSGVIDWSQYIRDVLATAGVPFQHNENILVESDQGIKGVVKLLNATDKTTLANFMLLNFVFSFEKTLGNRYQRMLSDQETLGKNDVSDKVPPRHTFCIAETKRVRGYAIASLFIREKFDNGSRTPILEVTKEIRTAFNESLKDVDWLSDQAKKIIREKNENISVIVGYTDEFTQSGYADTYYTPLQFDEKAFFNNSKAVRAELFKQSFKQLRDDRNTRQWRLLPYTAYTDYEPGVSQLYATTAVLQPPIFAKNYPKYLVYGHLGVWFALEILNGINISVDTNGKLNTIGGFPDRFQSKMRCFEDQLERSVDPVSGIKINRTNRLSARINALYSDGVRLGYKAYKNWTARHGKQEMTLPGLNYTQDQLFFLAFAQITCKKLAKQSVSSQNPSVHFYLNAMYQNSPEFADTFKCTTSARMNPRSKCAMWGKV